jgi:hypothetical protein
MFFTGEARGTGRVVSSGAKSGSAGDICADDRIVCDHERHVIAKTLVHRPRRCVDAILIWKRFIGRQPAANERK